MALLHLTKEEEKIYSGEYGWSAEKAIRVIVKVGEAMGAERLIRISHAHISGVGYANIGESGISLLKDLVDSGAKMRVYSTANPGSVDYESYRFFQYGDLFRERQEEIINLYRKMGVQTFTCTPYYVRPPKQGEYLSWAETNAVLIANSIYGAKTNREGGLLALMSGIIGKTYYGGLLVDENRAPDVLVEFKSEPRTLGEYGAAGLLLGEIVKSKIPYVVGIPKNSKHEKLKTFLAAVGSSGSTGLVIFDKITPESAYHMDTWKSLEKIAIDEKDIKNKVENSMCTEPEAYLIGCPHASLELLKDLAEMVSQRNSHPNKPIWVFTSHYIYNEAMKLGLIDKLKNRGINVFKGICGVISPLHKLGYSCIGTPSAKATFYLPKLAKTRFVLMELNSIIDDAYN